MSWFFSFGKKQFCIHVCMWNENWYSCTWSVRGYLKGHFVPLSSALIIPLGYLSYFALDWTYAFGHWKLCSCYLSLDKKGNKHKSLQATEKQTILFIELILRPKTFILFFCKIVEGYLKYSSFLYKTESHAIHPRFKQCNMLFTVIMLKYY